jgi:hypothetical protein
MLSKLLSKVIVLALRSVRITGEDKARVTTVLLSNIGALPFRDVFAYDLDGSVYVNGKKLSQEQLIALKESCKALNDSFSRKLINEQIRFIAVNEGVHKGLNSDMILFAKAALWVMDQEETMISTLMNR